MSEVNNLETICSILQATFDDKSLIVSRQTSAEDVDEWDSLSHIELISNIEKHFSIRFALGELQDLKSVGDMIDLIESKI